MWRLGCDDVDVTSCPHCGNENPSLIEGHEMPEEYDGILFWVCLSCGKAWRKIFGAKRLDIASRNYTLWWNQQHAQRSAGETP